MTDRRANRRTDRQTENTICRAAWSQLKIPNHNLKNVRIITCKYSSTHITDAQNQFGMDFIITVVWEQDINKIRHNVSLTKMFIFTHFDVWLYLPLLLVFSTPVANTLSSRVYAILNWALLYCGYIFIMSVVYLPMFFRVVSFALLVCISLSHVTEPWRILLNSVDNLPQQNTTEPKSLIQLLVVYCICVLRNAVRLWNKLNYSSNVSHEQGNKCN